ncbi:MAG: riboflavin kinase, partial [Bdellovibrionia bacterium]
MELVRGIEALSHSVIHPVVTIGNFDGVHLGHQKIIQLAIEKAKAKGGQSIAYTFRPHPQVALRPGTQVQLLTTYDEKLEILENLGIDLVIEEPFSREFSTIEPEIFFNEVLLRKLSAENIVVGYDFAFGKERHGHLETLDQFCKSAGVKLFVVQPQRIEGEVVSSSKIRQHLLSGEMDAAKRLMGRSFFYRGIVIKGEGRGHKIGFPTANLKLEDKLALPFGVYATWAIHEGILYPSV